MSDPRILRIALKVAGYDFKAKMKINALVLEEMSRLTGIDIDMVAGQIAESPVHEHIQSLADSISEEAENLKRSQAA
jgi:hypothetical protein